MPDTKIALKGFANLSYFPVTANDATTYTATPKTPVLGAQSLTRDDSRNAYTIYADDDVYDSGSDYQKTTVEIKVVQMTLAALAALCGAAYDSSTKVMQEKSTDIAPEVALTFSGLRSDGGYRLFKYFAAKLTGYKHDMNTRGENNDVGSYTLTFDCVGRATDKLVRETKDVDAVSSGTPDITWLDTVVGTPPSNED